MLELAGDTGRAYAAPMADDNDKTGGPSAAKWALMALGGLTAVGLALAILPFVIKVALVGGAGYLGYRFFTKKKALGGSHNRSLPSSSDYDAKMRKLDALSRKLDRDVGD